jgi:3-hydroxybutyryl-CoA dehydrogenase
MKVAILGAGVMGRNIARVFLRAGLDVALYSRSDATLEAARTALAGEPTEALGTTTVLADAVVDAGLVLESVPEDVSLKRRVLREVEDAAPERAVVASNTSSLPLEALASGLRRPERFLALHWFNPAHLVPLVEVVPAPATDPAVVRFSIELLERAGKRPLELRRTLPGFVANRLQYALVREALSLLEAGVADADSIDAALTDCLGPRWAVIGPLRATDLSGVEVAVAVAEQLYPHLSTATEPQAPLRELVARGELGARTGRGFYAHPDPEQAIADRDTALAGVLEAVDRQRT